MMNNHNLLNVLPGFIVPHFSGVDPRLWTGAIPIIYISPGMKRTSSVSACKHSSQTPKSGHCGFLIFGQSNSDPSSV